MPYEREREKDRENSRRKGWVLGDLEAWHAIQVTCTRCGRQSFVAPHELHARHRPTKIIGAIKLKCSACGCTEVTWEVVRARPPLTARDY
jgi:hypothetical protein